MKDIRDMEADAKLIAAMSPDERAAYDKRLKEHQDMLEIVDDVMRERARQIDVEGWTPAHDDEHSDGAMALAAVCYATPVLLYRKDERANAVIYKDPWPWSDLWDKRAYVGNQVVANKEVTSEARRRQLVKAGALIIAEIERLDRAIAKAEGAEQ